MLRCLLDELKLPGAILVVIAVVWMTAHYGDSPRTFPPADPVLAHRLLHYEFSDDAPPPTTVHDPIVSVDTND